jgi:hypothetical protein
MKKKYQVNVDIGIQTPKGFAAVYSKVDLEESFAAPFVELGRLVEIGEADPEPEPEPEPKPIEVEVPVETVDAGAAADPDPGAKKRKN